MSKGTLNISRFYNIKLLIELFFAQSIVLLMLQKFRPDILHLRVKFNTWDRVELGVDEVAFLVIPSKRSLLLVGEMITRLAIGWHCPVAR